MRLRLQDQKQVQMEEFRSLWPLQVKSGEVYIEWGNRETSYPTDGSLSIYNGAVLEIRPFGGAQAKEALAWTGTAGKGKTAGITA